MASALLTCWRRKDSSEPSAMATELTSINDLPDEILLEILSYFRLEDLCLVIANVCEGWKLLAKDVILWKELSFKCDSSSDISDIKEILINAPALHSFIIRSRKDVADILEFPNNKHIGLRKLILKYCYFGEDGTRLLANIVSLYPQLEVLSVERCRGLIAADYSLISRLKKLSELNLSDCEELSGDTVRLIAESCRHLKKLSLNGVRSIDDEDVIHVIRKLGKQLTALSLDGHGLTDFAYSHFNICARLQELKVLNCEAMTDRRLLGGIGPLHELTSLRLIRGRNLTAQALSTFLHQPSMRSIVLLDLSCCYNLDDEGLKGIATRCIHLKELVVSGCHSVTDAGISMVIIFCNQLHLLDLMGLPSITGEGWLVLMPLHLPHLRELCLEFCYNVVDKYVEELVAALPELKVTK